MVHIYVSQRRKSLYFDIQYCFCDFRVFRFLEICSSFLWLTFLVPGILELLCAIAYTTSTRSVYTHISPSESIICWVLALSSIVFGACIIFKDSEIMRVLLVRFLVNIPVIDVQNLVILGDSPLEVDWVSVNSWGSTASIFLWCVVTNVRQVILRQSTPSISQDSDRYDPEWASVKQDLESNTAI